jgi:hypothetical protein
VKERNLAVVEIWDFHGKYVDGFLLGCCTVSIISMVMKVESSEMSANIYHTTRCNTPEDSHLLTTC